MRLPNGYGSVYKDTGKRRKPWVARVTIGREYNEQDDRVRQKYKRLGSFTTRKEAMEALSKYNAGIKLADVTSISMMPTFEDVYNEWSIRKFDQNIKSSVSQSSIRNYKIAYERFSDVHKKKFANIRVDDLQEIFDRNNEKSRSTVGLMKTLVNQMYRYAIGREYTDKDYSKSVIVEWTNPKEKMHSTFTQEEIDKLWENVNEQYIDLVLMMIYSGVRPQEFVKIKCENIFLEENYFIGGMKTESGTNRVIPIHPRTKPFFEKYFDPENEFLVAKNKMKELTYRDRKEYFNYATFRSAVWVPVMEKMSMEHLPHDCRHTFATLMDQAGANPNYTKLILGHKMNDITLDVYTHTSKQLLYKEICKI